MREPDGFVNLGFTEVDVSAEVQGFVEQILSVQDELVKAVKRMSVERTSKPIMNIVGIASTIVAPQPLRPSLKVKLTGCRSSCPNANFLGRIEDIIRMRAIDTIVHHATGF